MTMAEKKVTLRVEIRNITGGDAELQENSDGARVASGTGLVDKINWDKMHEALDILKQALKEEK